jgi:hypothetical protein
MIHTISVDQYLCVSLNFSPTWFFWTFLMAHSKAKMKSSGDKESPSCKLFWIGKLLDKYSRTRL